MTELIAEYGLVLVFANVLLERAGLPLPSTPTLLVCGALAAQGQFSAVGIFAVSLIACTVGDTVWYLAGRIYGRRIMRLLCRMSLSPDYCVRQTEDRFEHWGRLTLVVSKFVPGLSTVVRPLAGAMRMGFGAFELLNGLGTVLWVGLTLWVGYLFHDEISRLLSRLHELGLWTASIVGGLLLLYLLVKVWERKRFERVLRLARITVPELRRLIDAKKMPVIVDVRSRMGRNQDRRCIPGALEMTIDEVETRLTDLPFDRDIVFYCACPNEATAAVATRKLLDHGYLNVRPLLGGLDAWADAGHSVEIRLSTEGRVDPAAVGVFNSPSMGAAATADPPALPPQ